MTDLLVTYIIFIVVAILAIFSLIIGLEKMIKVILGNYILSTICLAANQSIDILINFLNNTPAMKILGLTYGDWSNFLQQGKTTFILILYVLLLLLLYYKSKIRINLPSDEIIKKSLFIIMVPLTVTSVILTLEIAILGMNSININALQGFASSLTRNDYLYQFIALTPVWIFVHGLATVLITSEIKINIKSVP